jgi:hypothetical protein
VVSLIVVISLFLSDTRGKKAIFADCRGSSKVDAEIRSFAAILDGFCQAQANAYSARDDAGKAKVLNLVKSDLGTECQKLQ